MARKTRGGTVSPHGKMSPGLWRLSSRDAGWMMSTATTGKQETFTGRVKKHFKDMLNKYVSFTALVWSAVC